MVRSDDYMGAMDMIEKMGLLDKAHQKGDKLSGGEKQRIAMARALAHGAKTLLADEPVSGLDPHAAEQVLSDLKQMCRIQDVSVDRRHASRRLGGTVRGPHYRAE